jgi:hypothetical protein
VGWLGVEDDGDDEKAWRVRAASITFCPTGRAIRLSGAAVARMRGESFIFAFIAQWARYGGNSLRAVLYPSSSSPAL